MAILAHGWHGLHSGNGAVLWKTATGSWCSRHYTASCNNVSLNYYMVTGGSHENHSFYRAVARMKEEERWKEERRGKKKGRCAGLEENGPISLNAWSPGNGSI